jgi:hypothetical protein
MVPRFAVVAALLIQPAAAQRNDLDRFDWLTGTWEMVDGNRRVEEQWTSPTSNLMTGMSRTITDGRTSEFEFLRLEKRGDDVFYVPQPGGRPPVSFKLTSVSPERFVFENSSGEDRVSRIEYRRDGADRFHARVEGNQGGKPFVLEYHYARRR